MQLNSWSKSSGPAKLFYSGHIEHFSKSNHSSKSHQWNRHNIKYMQFNTAYEVPCAPDIIFSIFVEIKLYFNI